MVDSSILVLVLEVVVIFAGSWLLLELVIRLITREAKRSGAQPGLIRTVREVLSIVWFALATTAVLSIAGVASEFSFLTLSGIVGLAVSLALQSTLSNVISGVLLLSDGVLRLNDKVEYSGVKGVVVKIGLRATWVKTDRGDIAIISNNYLANGPLIISTATQRLEKKLRI